MAVSGEVLLCVDWCMDMLCLWAAGRWLRISPIPWRRLCLAALIGAACTLLTWPLPWLRRFPAPLLIVPGLCAIAYPGRRKLLPPCLCLAASAFLMGGSAWYFSMAFSAQLLGMMATGLIAPLLLLIRRPPSPPAACTQLELCHQGRSLVIPCMLDTGNLLQDPVTQLPVVVISHAALQPLIDVPQTISALAAASANPHFRLLPVRTAAGRSLMLCFRPERLFVCWSGAFAPADALIAVAPPEYAGMQALVPSSLSPGHSSSSHITKEAFPL